MFVALPAAARTRFSRRWAPFAASGARRGAHSEGDPGLLTCPHALPSTSVWTFTFSSCRFHVSLLCDNDIDL